MNPKTRANADGKARLGRFVHVLRHINRLLSSGPKALPRKAKKKQKAWPNARQRAREFRLKLDQYLAHFEDMNRPLGEVADAILTGLGYRRHNRGDWHLRDTSSVFQQFRNEATTMTSSKPTTPPTASSDPQVHTLIAAGGRTDVQPDADEARAEPVGSSGPGKKNGGPLIVHDPAGLGPEVRAVFERANRGNPEALARVRGWVRDRKWADWLGNLGREATRQLLALVSAGSPVWTVGLEEMAAQLLAEVEGEKPSVLEKLLARRVLNNWIAIYALEVERAVRDPKGDQLVTLDKAIGRADRRFQQAIHELAQIRRLQAPRVLLESVRGDAIIDLMSGPPKEE